MINKVKIERKCIYCHTPLIEVDKPLNYLYCSNPCMEKTTEALKDYFDDLKSDLGTGG